MNLKKTFKKLISFTAALVLAVGLLPSFPSSAAVSYESGYDFNDPAAMTWDLGGNYPLVEYSFDPFTPEEGHSGYGISSFFQFESEMFTGLTDLTVAFWLKLDHSISYNERVFYAGAESDYYPHVSFELAPDGLYTVTVYDGLETASVSFTTFTEDWTHIAFTFKTNYFGDNSLAIYYNGVKMGEMNTNVDLTRLSGKFSYMTNFCIDDLFISSYALTDSDVALMQIMSLREFMEYRGDHISSDVPDPDFPLFPGIDPEEPDLPEEPTLPDGWVFPEGLTKTNFTWLAYTFDGSFNAAKDLNKQADADINSFDSTLITIGEAKEGGGRALTRRSAVFPEQYMSLDQGLLFDAEEFTIAMKVYRETDKESKSYKLSNMNLFEFTGRGSLVFSPFKTNESGDSISKVAVDTEKDYGNDPFYVDITPEKTYELTKTSLSSVNGKWVHYAFTFGSKGTVNIYVNGVLTNTFETGVALTDLDLTELKIMTGSSETDDSRYYIDDVYIASRVLDAADIRRIEHYGVSRFVTEVLADPNPENSGGETPENTVTDIDLRPDSTDELEDGVYETAVINKFVGTTFDNMALIGADYNNSVLALIRNASLAQGNINYGLALDGMSSYIRYPLGILDNAEELTVSIAYNWAGSTSGTNHRLFDFSRKENSVSAPSAYMYLDMGNGTDGLKFIMSDGASEFVLATDHNVTNKWVRVSVTLKNGVVRLYIDGAEVASGETNITPASIRPNYNYVGKSGVKGGALFKGTVDEIYISDKALTAVELQTIQSYGIEPYVPTSSDPIDVIDEIDIWDTIINGVVLAAVVFIVILVIVIIVTIFKK